MLTKSAFSETDLRERKVSAAAKIRISRINKNLSGGKFLKCLILSNLLVKNLIR